MSNTRPLRIAVIGSGPSGFYAAEALLKQEPNVSVDIIDRLVTPYGLVRYGVAPDHQKIKSVTALYQKTMNDPRVRFLGHVEFGRDLRHEDVRRHYDAVVYATGASSDRNLGIPGEQLPGSMSATEFVSWYNGHPDYADREFHLTAQQVAVVGVGNVAVDVTRILTRSVDELRQTDIADHAISALEVSRVTDVYVLGRRGAAQAKFTTKELRELGELEGVDVVVKPEEVELDEASRKSLEGQPALTKNVEILQEFARRPLSGAPRRIHLRFLVSPVEILGETRVEGLRIERNRLVERGGDLAAEGSGEFETLPVGMVLRSVGYKGVALPGVPFDTRRGVIPNDQGRVTQDGQVVPGEYVAGWIKRGPSGVIGTNKACAVDTIKLLLADAPALPRVTDADADPLAVDALLRARGVDYVSFDDWLELDRFETEVGSAQGRPRVKVSRREEMLRTARRNALVQ
ncbi:ferredoxin--NADP+ reductase [Deinobacterium chartae]|uniref:Ferredoxin--NADP+ reductase n=1 Tax=Deinobacterium chartae TaxID=521158 RepID=A0A841HZE5_9DEIO|nr:FAD-dependent oxidoreductase [Deinobacterium chartae]MBB6097262.1 ferredoxin--NADP+ reductase [Deinobacterium chartae]